MNYSNHHDNDSTFGSEPHSFYWRAEHTCADYTSFKK